MAAKLSVLELADIHATRREFSLRGVRTASLFVIENDADHAQAKAPVEKLMGSRDPARIRFFLSARSVLMQLVLSTPLLSEIGIRKRWLVTLPARRIVQRRELVFKDEARPRLCLIAPALNYEAVLVVGGYD